MSVNIDFVAKNRIKVTVSNEDFQCSRTVRYWGAWLLKARLRRLVRVLKRAIAAAEAVERENNV